MLETVPARVREEAEGGPEDTEELEAVVGRIGPDQSEEHRYF